MLVIAHLAEIRRPTQHLCQLFRLDDAATIHDNLPGQRVLLAFLVHQRRHRVVRVVAVKSPDAILNVGSGGDTANHHHLLRIDACDTKKSIFVDRFQRRGQIHQLGFMLAQLDQRQHLRPPIVNGFQYDVAFVHYDTVQQTQRLLPINKILKRLLDNALGCHDNNLRSVGRPLCHPRLTSNTGGTAPIHHIETQRIQQHHHDGHA